MHIHETLFSIGLLIIGAKLLEGVFKRFGLNSIIAYAAAGVILGPLTGIVETGPETEIIFGLGIFVFFFLIGLEELDIKGFISAIKGRLFLAATVSVVISMAVSLAVTTDLFFDLDLGLTFTQALGLASVLSLSSLGLVAKVLIDEGKLKERDGVQIFTAVIIAELMALFVFGFAISEHAVGRGETLNLLDVATLIGQMIGFAIVIWFFSTKILPKLIEWLHRFLQVPQLSFGILLGGLLVVVYGAEEVGLHGSIGALLFGAALSILPFQVRHDIMPGMNGAAEGFFVPLFFASAGLHLSFDFTVLPVVTIIVLTFVPLIGKFVASVIGAYAARLDAPFATASGLMAKGVAEIALLLLLFQTGAIDKSLFSLLVLVMFAYILITPVAISRAIKRIKPAVDAPTSDEIPPSLYRFALEGIKVNDIIDPARTYPDQSLTVRAFTEQWLLPEQQDYVVVDRANNHQLAGIVSISMLRYLPRHEWDTTTLTQTLRHNTPTATTEDYVEDALQTMTENSITILPVIDPETNQFIGSIASHEVLEMVVEEAQGH
ncbi:MAG: cation:proton antiporter [Chloroflexi bacterium]|nr:cation:proton antiporter [Chloroflexota bacterium]